jgi:glycerol kinase
MHALRNQGTGNLRKNCILSCGLYPNTAALSSLWRSERRFEPRISAAQAQEKMQRWEHAVRQATAL